MSYEASTPTTDELRAAAVSIHKRGVRGRHSLYHLGANPTPPLITERILWRDAVRDPPDDSTTVLVSLPDDDEPVWMGYRDGDEWRSVDGMPFAGVVVRWADMPKGAKR